MNESQRTLACEENTHYMFPRQEDYCVNPGPFPKENNPSEVSFAQDAGSEG